MEILNYDEQPPGGSCLAIFSVYIPPFRLTIHKVRLIRTKKGALILGLPSYAIPQPDGSKKWHSYIEFSAEKAKEFNEKVMEALQTFIK
jgi:hypothetical protein